MGQRSIELEQSAFSVSRATRAEAKKDSIRN